MMKWRNFVFIFAFLTFLNFIVARSAQAQTSPSLIYNCQDLQKIGANVNAPITGYYQLANDIDCSALNTSNNGIGFLPIGFNVGSPIPFEGTFDGAGHTISNLYINMTANPCQCRNFIRWHSWRIVWQYFKL